MFGFATNPDMQLHAYPESPFPVLRLAFLSYFRIAPKSLSTTPSGAKHDAIYNKYYSNIISGEVVPVRVPEPVPAVQVRRAGIRSVPEVPALRHESLCLFEGRAPLPLWGIHPHRPFNRGRGRARARARACPSSSGTKSRHPIRSRGTRLVSTL